MEGGPVGPGVHVRHQKHCCIDPLIDNSTRPARLLRVHLIPAASRHVSRLTAVISVHAGKPRTSTRSLALQVLPASSVCPAPVLRAGLLHVLNYPQLILCHPTVAHARRPRPAASVAPHRNLQHSTNSLRWQSTHSNIPRKAPRPVPSPQALHNRIVNLQRVTVGRGIRGFLSAGLAVSIVSAAKSGTAARPARQQSLRRTSPSSPRPNPLRVCPASAAADSGQH